MIDIGPSCFASDDEKVINYLGNNYYRACDQVVANNAEGGVSFCVKREDHPGDIHEDYDGRTRQDGTGLCGALSEANETCKYPENHSITLHSWSPDSDGW